MDTLETHETPIDFMKRRIALLSWTVLLNICAIFVLILSLVYDSIVDIPSTSFVAVLSFVACLSGAVFYLARVASNRAINAVSDYGRRLSTLLVTSKEIHDIGYSDMLLENIMDVAMEMTSADGGSLVLREEDGLRCRIARGPNRASLSGAVLPEGRGVVGWVVGEGRAVRVSDARDEERFDLQSDGLIGAGTGGVLCVPLKVKSATVGALELVSARVGAFRREDGELLQYFADQAALSLEKTRFQEDQNNFEIHLTNILIEAIENVSGKRGHSKRVAKYALTLADGLGIAEKEKKRLYRASMLHDIGFLKIETGSRLSIDQYEAHSKLGYDLLKPVVFYSDILPAILHHHERYDGRGYPSGLAAAEIPVAARIICIAEAFDSMVSGDSYKIGGVMIREEIMPSVVDFDTAMDELKRNSGSQFDPELVAAFEEHLSFDDLG